MMVSAPIFLHLEHEHFLLAQFPWGLVHAGCRMLSTSQKAWHIVVNDTKRFASSASCVNSPNDKCSESCDLASVKWTSFAWPHCLTHQLGENKGPESEKRSKWHETSRNAKRSNRSEKTISFGMKILFEIFFGAHCSRGWCGTARRRSSGAWGAARWIGATWGTTRSSTTTAGPPSQPRSVLSYARLSKAPFAQDAEHLETCAHKLWNTL